MNWELPTRRTFLRAALFTGLAPLLAWHGRGADGQSTELERHLYDVFRQIRLDHNLHPFRTETTLAEISRGHAQNMLRRRFFDHQSPDGEGMVERVARGHRRLIGLTGENLWTGTGVDVSNLRALSRRIAKDLMASPGHRENILRANYTHMGVGVETEPGEVRVVQLFAQVDAYLNHPLPPRLRSGQLVDLSVQLVASRGDAVRFDLYSLQKQRMAAGPVLIGQPLPAAAPGEYSLRFYFRTVKQRQLKIVYGPSFRLG